MVTVFPDPDSPTIPTVSPSPTSKLRPSTTRVRPGPDGKLTLSPSTDSSAPCRPAAAGGTAGRAGAGPVRLRRGLPRDWRPAGRNAAALQASVAVSRTASPSRQSARIVSAIAIPGGQISQLFSRMTLVPFATIPPQLGAGAGTSRLRNASPVWKMSASAARNDAWTITAPEIRGRTWRVRM